MAFIIAKAVQGAAAGIGLASESYTAHKEKKKAKSEHEVSAEVGECDSTKTSHVTIHEKGEEKTKAYGEDEDHDQLHWELDEIQDQMVNHSLSTSDSPPPYELALGTTGSHDQKNSDSRSATESKNPALQAHLFLLKYPAPSPSMTPYERLPFPVVLPQRRPHDRSRGFVRAYAPVLASHGIHEQMFLEFIETFDRASQASPWISAINLASLFTSFLPEGISFAVSRAIRIATKVAIEMQTRERTNKYLDQLNDQFYRPRGLFCLIMTWDPTTSSPTQTLNLQSKVLKAASGSAHGVNKLQNKFQSSSGSTFELPATAPLIYPALDRLAPGDLANPAAQTTLKNLGKKREFLNDYMDRRAQAQYASDHPDGMLAQGPKPKFTSRYADPNHPAASGDLVALVTGGHASSRSLRGGGGGGLRGGLGRGGQVHERRGLLGAGPGGGGRDRGGILGGGGGLGRGGHLLGGGRRRRRGGFVDGRGPYAGGEYAGEEWNEGDAYSRHEGARAGGSRRARGNGGLVGGIKKVLQQDVLYLLVVNLPTAEELADVDVGRVSSGR